MNGQPSVADYGGVAEGGPSRWLSGYEKYYNGMFNRVEQVYQIHVGTPDGLLTLKNWLHNHLEGADVGGIACFYSPSPWNTVLLPEGTPEGGKHVITQFSGTPGHASPITGWNDSIRFDYNYDGQYTNHIDINNDGIVDMRDWEIGGLLFTDSYLGGLNWADSGYCYMMYKTLADNVYEGGIWNHVVHVVQVKEDYVPLITLKIKLKHTARETIKVLAGIAPDTGSENPTRTLGFPIFDYQGGFQYMQGGTNLEENKTIEFGLDITPLLGEINSGEPARFFLLVDEKDPDGFGTGEIVAFSVMDYNNGLVEYAHPDKNIPLQNDGLTTVYIDAVINFNQPEIEDNELPVAFTNEPYSHQMTATGGIPPHQWKLVRHFEQESFAGLIPPIEGDQVELNDPESGFGLQTLEFEFPFYGKTYDSVYIHVDGFLQFDDQYLPWPYLYDEHLFIRKIKCISPYFNRFQSLGSESNGIWYEGNEHFAAFWWKTNSNNPETENLEYAVFLHASGEIEFYYSDQMVFTENLWAAGISEGDGINYQMMNSDFEPGWPILFTPEEFPDEMSLSETGLFSGIPEKNYPGINVEFLLTDHQNIPTRKILPFYSFYESVDENSNQTGIRIKTFPNPFTDQINIVIHLEKTSPVFVEIFDTKGSSIATIADGSYTPGEVRLVWDGSTNNGEIAKNGIYFVVLKTEEYTSVSRIVLIKND
jgi:hypothetical protein